MRIRKLGRTGLKVSNLCLGAMTFGNSDWGCDEGTSRKIVDRFLDAGGNFIDTADVYSSGVSEEITGRAIAEKRQQVILATKVAGPMGGSPNDLGLSRKHILDGIDASLRRLGTDYIDVYQVHAYDPTSPLDETLRALDDCVRAGTRVNSSTTGSRPQEGRRPTMCLKIGMNFLAKARKTCRVPT